MLQLVTAIVALLFAIWFGKAALRAGLSPFEWAIGGATLSIVVSIVVPVVGLLLLRKAAGEISSTTTFVVGAGLWLAGITAAILLAGRLLPEPTQDQLRVMLAAQKAKSEQAAGPVESLSCAKCGAVVAKTDVLRLGAIRIDDRTCICPSCKQAGRRSV